jgi:hypothetical protein
MIKKHKQDPPGFWQEEYFGSDGDDIESLYEQDDILKKHPWIQESIDQTAVTKKHVLTKDLSLIHI